MTRGVRAGLIKQPRINSAKNLPVISRRLSSFPFYWELIKQEKEMDLVATPPCTR